MVRRTHPPDTRAILPPLLACLPTAFASPRPPPALLPLLSPILRQRVNLNIGAADGSSGGWLSSLCWDSDAAAKLVNIVTKSDLFELHPVSGEVDYGQLKEIRYRRMDEETLQARVGIPDLSLIVTYLWCEVDEAGSETRWLVSEVRPGEQLDQEETSGWYSSIAEAEGKARERIMTDAIKQVQEMSIGSEASDILSPLRGSKEENDDDYWGRYLATPGTRSARSKVSPAPFPSSISQKSSNSEADYFARYASVQPEMDNDDPDGKAVEREEAGTASYRRHPPQQHAQNPRRSSVRSTAEMPNLKKHASPTSFDVGGPALKRVESVSVSQAAMEVAIKHHVSTSMKSLYRLCRGTGMEIDEFQRLIRIELETFSMLEENEVI